MAPVPKRTVLTTEPDPPAPVFVCPVCRGTLVYRQTALSGVPTSERWDLFDCDTCGPFEYRHRTRRLRQVGAVEVVPDWYLNRRLELRRQPSKRSGDEV
jgi:hypothetical protein